MKMLSLSEAAKATGRGKSTISKAIKTGRLSAKRDGSSYQIDPSELFRVYPKSERGEPQHATEREPAGELAKKTTNELLELENKMLKEQIERERAAISDLKEDRDKWRQQATALLEDKRAQKQDAEPKKRKWWHW